MKRRQCIAAPVTTGRRSGASCCAPSSIRIEQKVTTTMSSPHNAPPEILDRPLEVGPDDWQGRAFYFLMNALVVPRPIGWISTLSANGIRNLAPYSHFNLMGSNPFYL